SRAAHAPAGRSRGNSTGRVEKAAETKNAYAATLGAGETFTTVELKINFLRAVRTGKLTAEARVIKAGNTLGYVECDVKAQTGKLVAGAASRCMKLRQDRQSPAQKKGDLLCAAREAL